MKQVKILAIALSFFASSAGVAHDWYPAECCSGSDCAPVEKVEIIPGTVIAGLGGGSTALSAMRVTTRIGSAIVPATATRRESKDHQMHACIQRGYLSADRLICIFFPPGT